MLCSGFEQINLGLEKGSFKQVNLFVLDGLLCDFCYVRENDRFEDDYNMENRIVENNNASKSLILNFLTIVKCSGLWLCSLLVDIFGSDLFNNNRRRFFLRPVTYNRFFINYILRSFLQRLRIGVGVETYNARVLSVGGLFCGAVWCEREIWDMFGINFLHNSDLRRILTDYGFRGFPLQKDFPVVGFTEVRYDSEQPGILYSRVVLQQEDRRFRFTVA